VAQRNAGINQYTPAGGYQVWSQGNDVVKLHEKESPRRVRDFSAAVRVLRHMNGDIQPDPEPGDEGNDDSGQAS
jgi:hypothetical protein